MPPMHPPNLFDEESNRYKLVIGVYKKIIVICRCRVGVVTLIGGSLLQTQQIIGLGPLRWALPCFSHQVRMELVVILLPHPV